MTTIFTYVKVVLKIGQMEKFKNNKKITKRYFAKRTLNEMTPEEWVQAILDTNSSRKKGKCGENKLVHILKKQGFKEFFNWDDFLKTDYCVVKFSKKFNLKNVRENLGVKIKTKKQNKTLDLIIKAKDKILLCEAKHLNTSGGGQDKQISELIEILRLTEKNGVSYISFFASSIILSQAFIKQENSEQLENLPIFLDNSKKYLSITADFSFLSTSVFIVIKIFFISFVFFTYLSRSAFFSSNT